MTAVIEVTGLTKRYGGQAVVDGISFRVNKGEIFGILGPNGAGKTLGIGSVFALGMVAAPAAPTARSAAGIGWLLFFPNMFLAGIYFPTELMSSTMRQIGNFMPLGSALHAVRDSWMGLDPRPEYLGIMAAYAVIAGALPAVSTVAIWVLLACVDVVLVGAFTALGVKSEEQNQARKGMIAELAEANQRLEEMMAENTGLQAQLLTQAREVGTADERQRMAREIHDTLAQGLTGIITQLEAAQQTASDAERERRIGNAKRLARDSLAEARRSVQALRPQALENSRLPEALADEVARWSATSGVAGEVETTGAARPLHPEVEVTLLRVAQEALANVAKHAGASRAGVTLSYMEDVVSLDVRDDGVGFVPPDGSPSNGSAPNGSAPNGSAPNGHPAGGGFGLISMRQRVSRLAGQLEIESEPGGGTAVSASLPAIGLGESK